MPYFCHLIIRRALNVTSCVLITASGDSCHLGTAWKCYTELFSALCKIFWGVSLPNDNPRLWNSSGQSSCLHPYFYIDALFSCREKCCSRCSSVLCIPSDKEQSLTNLPRYPSSPGTQKRLMWSSSSTEEEFGHFCCASSVSTAGSACSRMLSRVGVCAKRILQLASPLCYLQVSCGKVLLHVLLEGFFKELLALLQLHLLGVLHVQNLLCMFSIEFSWA